MSAVDLQNPVRDSGIRSINFFNGRLLTARDLTREQTANRDVDKQLGQAIGDGVASGFEVSTSDSRESTIAAPLLKVTPGLAINRRGQTLQLVNDTDIALVRGPNTNGGAAQAFNECVPLQTGTYIAGAGVYLLTVAPAQTTEGLAPVAGLDQGVASCNTDTIISTLQFRLVQLNPPLTDAELDDENHLRNLVAYKCFGVDDLRALTADPFGSALKQYGLLDALRPNRVTDCDVPLAVVYWTLEGGVKFVDMWSVRRSPTRLNRAGGWSHFVSDRRAREGEAMFLQFQEQLKDLRPFERDRALTAKSRFRHLPPVGILPFSERTAAGFRIDSFFEGVPHRDPELIDGSLLNALISEAINFDPIPLVDPDDPDHCEMVWLYQPWQNKRSTGQSYVVFTSAHVPYVATPRFDKTRWDGGNYPSLPR